jgi:hypothetical protein
MHHAKIKLAAGRSIRLEMADGTAVSGVLAWVCQTLSGGWELCLTLDGERAGTIYKLGNVTAITDPQGVAIPMEELAGDMDVRGALHASPGFENSPWPDATRHLQMRPDPVQEAGLRPFIRFCAALFVWIGIAVMVLFGVVALGALGDGGLSGGMLSALIGLGAGASITLVGGSTYVICQIAEMLAARGGR